MSKKRFACMLGGSVTSLGIILMGTSAEAMVLGNAIGQALYSNPQIKANESEARAVQQQICQEKSGYYPTLDVEASTGNERVHNNYKVNELNSAPVKGTVDQSRHESSVRVVQPIFSGFDTVNRVQKREDEHTQAEKKVDETAVLAGFKAGEAYIGVRRFQRLWRLTHENVQKHQEIAHKVRQLVKGGKATAGDLHTVLARLADARTAEMDVLGNLSTAIADFINETGIHPDHLQNAKIDDTKIPKTLEEAIDLSLENNRSVILARSSLTVTKTDIKVAKAPFYPTVNLEADARHSHNVDGKKGYENNAKALLVLRWNLFKGGSDLYRHKEYTERMVKAKDELRNTLRVAEREVRVSWGERTSAALQAESLRKAVSSKERVVQTFAKQFDLAKVSLLDLLDVMNEWFLAKGSLITADATQDLTELRLLASCGILLQALDLPQSGVPYVASEDLGEVSKHDATESLVQDIIKGNLKFTRQTLSNTE